jgi:hypothetical protein
MAGSYGRFTVNGSGPLAQVIHRLRRFCQPPAGSSTAVKQLLVDLRLDSEAVLAQAQRRAGPAWPGGSSRGRPASRGARPPCPPGSESASWPQPGAWPGTAPRAPGLPGPWTRTPSGRGLCPAPGPGRSPSPDGVIESESNGSLPTINATAASDGGKSSSSFLSLSLKTQCQPAAGTGPGRVRSGGLAAARLARARRPAGC